MDLVSMMSVGRALVRDAVERSVLAVLTVAGAAALGLCWGQPSPRWIALTPFVVLLWWFAGTRWRAFFVGTAYHAVAARSLMQGMSQFFEVSLVVGVVVVLAISSVLGGVWAACWTDSERKVSLSEAGVRIVALLGSAFLPVLGSISLASPLTGAGLLFRGLGWVGLAVLVVSLVLATRWRTVAVGVVLVCAFRCAAFDVRPLTAPVALEFEAVHTSVGVSRDMFDFESQWEIAQASMSGVRLSRSRWAVLPESVGGLWQRTMERAWSGLDRELADAERSALVGVTLPRADGDFDNGVVVLGKAHATYRQRMPIPLAMWRPWAEQSGEGVFHAHWFGSGVVRAEGRVLGVLVCFEGGLPWTVLGSIAQGAEVLVAVTNGQWLEGTGAVNAQRQTLESWGALFGLPVVLATNE